MSRNILLSNYLNIVDIAQTMSKVGSEAEGVMTFSEKLKDALELIKSNKDSTNGLAKGLHAVSTVLGTSAASVLKFAGIAGVAIAGVSLAVQTYKNHWEELNKQADAASESYQNTVSSIEEYKTQISSLKSSLDNGNLSEEEAYNVRVQLLSIQDELIEKYGLEANALNVLGEAADSTNEKLDGITENEALRNLDENQAAYEKAAKEMEQTWGRKLQLGKASDDKSFMAELNEFVSSYSDVLNIAKNAQGTPFAITVQGNTTEAYNALNDLYDFMLNHGKDFSDGGVLKESVSTMLDSVSSVFDEYHDRYESYLIQSIAVDPEASGIMNTVEGYVSAMQTAITSGDWSAVSKNIDLLSGINLDDSSLPENIKEYIQGIIDEAVAAAEKHEVEIKVPINLVVNGCNQRRYNSFRSP